MNEHQTPWHVGGYDNDANDHFYQWVAVDDASGETVFTITIPGLRPGREEHVALAGRIIRAVNEREALVAMIEAARNELGVPQLDYPAPVANAVEILTEALALAEEKSDGR